MQDPFEAMRREVPVSFVGGDDGRIRMERQAMAAPGGPFTVGQPVKVVDANGAGVLWDEIASITASKIRLTQETRPGWNLDGSPADPVHQGRRLVSATWKMDRQAMAGGRGDTEWDRGYDSGMAKGKAMSAAELDAAIAKEKAGKSYDQWDLGWLRGLEAAKGGGGKMDRQAMAGRWDWSGYEAFPDEVQYQGKTYYRYRPGTHARTGQKSVQYTHGEHDSVWRLANGTIEED